MKRNVFVIGCGLLLAATAGAEIQIVTGLNRDGSAGFRFDAVPPPSTGDAAGKFELIDGEPDANSASLDKLTDGRLPSSEDQPAENFFFRAGSGGGRLLLALDRETPIQQINSYSWHPSTRGPQVYTLYASTGDELGFELRPGTELEPTKQGWTLIAHVDTREVGGGQHGVSVRDSSGLIGSYRYLLFDVARTQDQDSFGNTFYSEIDVIVPNGSAMPIALNQEERRQTIEIADGKYRITIDTSDAPDLEDWISEQIVPMAREWYPKLVALLPSDGYEAPERLSIVFSASMRGVAAASGTRIRCSVDWMRRNLDGEAKGAILHELVHVVQQYGRARRNNPNATRTPGWLVEGIPDYIRWYLYEPETKGAEITARNLARTRYDASYRFSANFLNWVVQHHGDSVIPKLNDAARHGTYTDELWVELTGKKVADLGEEWKAIHSDRLREGTDAAD